MLQTIDFRNYMPSNDRLLPTTFYTLDNRKKEIIGSFLGCMPCKWYRSKQMEWVCTLKSLIVDINGRILLCFVGASLY